jgi:hypothetical protein
VLAGAAISVGALKGRVRCGQSDEPAYGIVAEFRDAFAVRYGTTKCGPIRDAQAMHPEKCRPVVEEGTRMLMRILERSTTALPGHGDVG